MLQATSTLTWIPVGVILIYVIVKNNEFPKLLTTIAMLVACVAICTTLSEISKALFEVIFMKKTVKVLFSLVLVCLFAVQFAGAMPASASAVCRCCSSAEMVGVPSPFWAP